MDKKINLAHLEGENERPRRQLAELDKLPMRKSGGMVSDLKGVQDMTTSVGKGISSIPQQDDRYYLELYLLQKERERLVKEIASTKKRRLQLEMKVSHIDEEIAEKEEKARAGMTILSSEPTISEAEAHEKGGKEEATGKKQEERKGYEYKEEDWNRLTFEY